ncbi:MAG TPA: DUF2382 domain-containing protein [Burkholderiales bacterium]|nr:DUF2382 domain-containing protein [Burkholderiales bacterium]
MQHVRPHHHARALQQHGSVTQRYELSPCIIGIDLAFPRDDGPVALTLPARIADIHGGESEEHRICIDASGQERRTQTQTEDANVKKGEIGRIPVVREELTIGKRVVKSGQGVRITKSVTQREQVVNELLARDDVVVERVRVDQVVDAAKLPGVRQEGDTMIVPVLEEVLFVEKRVVLKEEVRITSKRREVREPQRVVLRSERVSVEPLDE